MLPADDTAPAGRCRPRRGAAGPAACDRRRGRRSAAHGTAPRPGGSRLSPRGRAGGGVELAGELLLAAAGPGQPRTVGQLAARAAGWPGSLARQHCTTASMAGGTPARPPASENDGGSSVAWASSTSIVDRPANGSRPGQQLEQDDADAVQVAAMVHLLAADLLGAHVAGRADGELGVAVGDCAVRSSPVVEQLGQAEIHHLDHFVGRVGIDDHQVGRLQIAVDDALGVGGLQHLAQLAEQPADAHRTRAGRCGAAAYPA